MSEFLPEVAIDMWAEAIKEVKARRESMSWACDKLAKLEAEVALTRRRLEYHESTLRDVRHAISEKTNPKLASPATREEER